MAKPEPVLPTLLTKPQVGRYLNASLDTVDTLIASGKLPACQFGPRSVRVRLEDVEGILVPVQPRHTEDRDGGSK